MDSEPHNRCTIVELDSSDLRRAVDDPKLMLLVHEGYTVLTSFAHQDNPNAAEQVVLVMAPPKPTNRVERQLSRWAPIVAGLLAAMVAVEIAVALWR